MKAAMKGIYLIVGSLVVAGVIVGGLYLVENPPATAASGQITENAYLFTNSPSPSVVTHISAPKFGFTPLKTGTQDGGAGGDRIPGWKHPNGYLVDTAFGGMGRTRYTTSNTGTTGTVTVSATDAGTGSLTPRALHAYAGGANPGTNNYKGMIWKVTAVANNGTDFAEWELQGAVKNSSGTLTAIGSAAVVGTAIAPTNRTTGAKEWRITPVSNSGYLDLLLFVGALDGGASPAGDVTWWVDEVTLP